VEGRLLLDVVVRKSAAVLKLLAGEDQALLIGRDTWTRKIHSEERIEFVRQSFTGIQTLLVLDLGLDVLNRVRGLDLKRNGLAREGLHEDLHLQYVREM
jgi:hypothetical protein